MRTLILALLVALCGLGTTTGVIRAAVDSNGWTPERVQDRIAYWSGVYGVAAGGLMATIDCETGGTYRTDLVGAAGEIGPGQWLPSTWAALASGTIGDPDDNIRETVRAHADGYAGQWTCG